MRGQIYNAIDELFYEFCAFFLLERAVTDVARAVVGNWVMTFGATDCLYNYQGANICKFLLLEVLKNFEIERTSTSPYHQQ